MSMKVIAVLNQKGGSGKTTIATHLARAFQFTGSSVVLIDSDPQGSARDWSAAREEQPLSVIGIDRPTIERDLKSLAATDFAVIDGAPQAADLAVSAIKAADFVLIPVQPSPYDIWAAADLVDLVKQRIEVTDGKLQAAFVVSRAIHGTKTRTRSWRRFKWVRFASINDTNSSASNLPRHRGVRRNRF